MQDRKNGSSEIIFAKYVEINLDIAIEFYIKSNNVHIESHPPKKRCMKNLIFHLVPALFFLQSHGHAQLGQNLTEISFTSFST